MTKSAGYCIPRQTYAMKIVFIYLNSLNSDSHPDSSLSGISIAKTRLRLDFMQGSAKLLGWVSHAGIARSDLIWEARAWLLVLKRDSRLHTKADRPHMIGLWRIAEKYCAMNTLMSLRWIVAAVVIGFLAAGSAEADNLSIGQEEY